MKESYPIESAEYAVNMKIAEEPAQQGYPESQEVLEAHRQVRDQSAEECQ